MGSQGNEHGRQPWEVASAPQISDCAGEATAITTTPAVDRVVERIWNGSGTNNVILNLAVSGE